MLSALACAACGLLVPRDMLAYVSSGKWERVEREGRRFQVSSYTATGHLIWSGRHHH
jgi:hypothetical protein